MIRVMSDKLVNVKGNGNFIITAPHTIYVKRLKDIHLPENNIRRIVELLEEKINKKYLTTITWNVKKNTKETTKLLDPNYYSVSKLNNSLWYQILKDIKLRKKNKNINRMLLVDLHGMNSIKEYDIILGIKSIKKFIGTEKYRKILAILVEIFERLKLKYGLNIGYNVVFMGHINEKYYTLSQQGCSLGIPSIQIELSKRIRNSLVKNDKLMSDFAKILLNVYKLNYTEN